MDYERTIGVFFITVCVASFLAGATTIQTYIYNVNYRKDPLILKAMVAVVWMLSMLHTTLLIYAVYDQTLKALSSTLIDTRLPRWAPSTCGHFSRFSLNRSPGPRLYEKTLHSFLPSRTDLGLIQASLMVSSIQILLCQLFLASRVYKYVQTFLVRWKSIAILVIFLCCITATFAACLTGIIRMFTFTFVFQAQILPLMTACFNISVDVSITAFLVWALMKSKTGLRESDQALRIITIFSINTGLLPAVFATAGLISYLVVPNTYWYWFCIYLLSDTYANTILANLNSRTFFKERLHPSLNSTAGSNFIQNALQHIHSPTIFPTSGVCRDSIALEFDSSKTTRPTTAMTVVANWRDVADIDHELANDNMPPDRTAVAVI